MTATLPPRRTVSDGDLVERARTGDQRAFDRLYERHVDSVRGVCASRVSGADVDDVIQDSFVKAWQKIDQLAEPEAFGAWIRAIAARGCIDLHRGSGRHTFASDEIDEAAIVGHGSDELLVRREAAASVHRNLAQLPERDREALFLRDGMEASITELADRYDLTEGSTRVMLTRARKKLRASWAAVIAWIVGLRGLRNLGQVSPQLVAASAVAIAAPILAVGVLTGGATTSDPTAPTSITTLAGTTGDAPTASATTPAAVAAANPTDRDDTPVTATPIDPMTSEPGPTPTADTVAAVGVGNGEVGVTSDDRGGDESIDVDGSAGNTGDNEVEATVGNIDDAIQEMLGTESGDSSDDQEPDEDETDDSESEQDEEDEADEESGERLCVFGCP